MTLSALESVYPVLVGFEAGRDVLAASPVAIPLDGGSLNRTVRVRCATADWVIRQAGSDDPTFGIDRDQELRVHRLAAQFGFAPRIVHADPRVGALVTAYVDAPILDPSGLTDPARVQMLGARLRALHRLPVSVDIGRIEVPATIDRYLGLPAADGMPVPRGLIAARLSRPLADYRRSGDALCHHDLHHANILSTDPLCFIDWEYGGVGDPLFELAAVICYHDLSARSQEILVAAYDQTLDRDRLADACVLFDGLHALWLDTADGWAALTSTRREALIRRLTPVTRA